MAKKIFIYIIVVIFSIGLVAGSLFGCAKTDGAMSTGYAFVDALVRKDYSDAYNYVYALTSDVKSKDEFIARFNNIYDALEITDIKLVDRNVEKVADSETEYTLTYKLDMTSGLLGNVTYEYSADIVKGPQGYTVLYMPNLILPALEEGDKVRAVTQTGKRGEIFAADGTVLARNDYAQSIYIDLEKGPNIDEVKGFLQTNYGVDPEKVQKKYENATEKGFTSEVLATYPKGTLTQQQKQEIAGVNGLGVDENKMTPMRYYPLKDDAAHIIGYLGSPDDDQLNEEAGITESSIVGKTGLERQYEDTLRGTNGKAVYIEDDKGNRKETLYEDAKTDGLDVTLTIDSKKQQDAYTLMAANIAAGDSGAVVVMDYTNGDVKALVSYPSFDSNLFNFALDQEIVEHYMGENSNSPMLNRATQSIYTPGSTFKPFTAAAAMENGKLTDQSTLPFEEKKREDGKTGYTWTPDMPGWVYPAINSKEIAGGDRTFKYAMKSSDNIYFAYYALQVGVDDFKAYMERIGMGEAPSFELPVKASSMMSQDPPDYSLNWLALTGFGTGEVQISPLQMATMYTAFENSGNMLNPTIMQNISHTDENGDQVVDEEAPHTVFKEGTMSQATINMQMPALEEVMVTGTAALAKLGSREGIYGKTGTAQFGPNNSREWNWVVSIDPATQCLYLVIVEANADQGSKPKLNILSGLVDESKYDLALQQIVQDN
ncbi:MAG: penicillin-binding transpeptidase domain-containing protein [Christensenella sp.]|uniref:penicillin-binding transpeptidase domain-containing protein n=1 Tax=Christensenella sp. TaxID=1935934 RepID=UPI002B1EE13B|nr:penicillin-binding transpeptidase domain-containing protein [Christensenella sp.]MEA5002616.1 penicillin-binding transpeptidase domain-containing protein [Christensenella sp.]